MTADGRLTIPATARREAGVEADAQFEVHVEDGDIVLRRMIVPAREDAWAHTVKHRRLLEKAHRDVREGRTRRLTESDLERLGR
jgi:bifunctional DNA-binding transcriptional regulator/antitoxin component of YhaV-PrlF toxin-antitoxin module